MRTNVTFVKYEKILSRIKQTLDRHYLKQKFSSLFSLQLWMLWKFAEFFVCSVMMNNCKKVASASAIGNAAEDESFANAVQITSQSLQTTTVEGVVPAYSLFTSDQKFVVMSQEFWHATPVLRDHSLTGRYFQIFVPERTVHALNQLHRKKKLPGTLVELFDLIALAKQLKLKSSLKILFDFYCTGMFVRNNITTKISESEFPSECKVSTVLEVLDMLCDSFPRADVVYESFLQRLYRYSLEPELVEKANNMLSDKSFEKLWQNTEGLSCPFDQTEMSVAILRKDGMRQTAVTKLGTFTQVKVPGFEFDRGDSVGILDFFLVYNEYIIYRDFNANVFFKNINSPMLPMKCYDKVIQFFVKSEHLFLLNTEAVSGSNEILKWNATKFIRLNTRGIIGTRLDFDPVFEQLFYVDASRRELRVDVLQGFTLFPYLNISVAPDIRHFVFHNRLLYIFAGSAGFCYDSNGVPAAGSKMILGLTRLSEISDSRVIGDELFLKHPSGWIVSNGNTIRYLSNEAVIEAINSVSLNPYFTEGLQQQ